LDLLAFFFTQLLKDPGQFGKTRAFEQERILVDDESDVWTGSNYSDESKNKQKITLEEIVRRSNPNAIRLPGREITQNGLTSSACGSTLSKGTYEFDFCFKLPIDGLYTSFDSKNAAGNVRYYVQIQVWNGAFSALRQKLLFPVVCPKKLSEPPFDKISNEGELVEKEFGKGEKTLKVSLRLTKCGYVPGEPLIGTISINNRLSKSIKSAFLRIKQRTICYANKPDFQMHESFFETAGMELPRKIRSKESLEYPICFYVPALLPNLHVPECIETDYSLELDVGTVKNSRRSSILQLRTALLIGTHPTIQKQNAHLTPLLTHASKISHSLDSDEDVCSEDTECDEFSSYSTQALLVF